MEKVVVITVTYNDAIYMKKCVDALISQTYPISQIIIVDNNSNKENAEIINEILERNADKLIVLHLEENLGGAGGFQKGMEYAKDNLAPDWYWIMDADAYPRENCLKKLLLHKDDKPNIGYLAPLIYGVDLQQYQWYHHKKLAKYLDRDIPLFNNYSDVPDVSEIVADAFVGPLFSKKAVEKVGVADGSLFIYGDDLEYTYRVTRDFDALLIKDAVINHRDQPAANGMQQPKNWWKDYYMYRNRILFIEKFQNNAFPKSIGYILVWLRLVKESILNIKTNTGALRKLRHDILWQAFRDGKAMKRGKTLDPIIYKVELLSLYKDEKNVKVYSKFNRI
jgi:GT2 family glycosyltransferase